MAIQRNVLAQFAHDQEAKISTPSVPRNIASLRIGMLGEDRSSMFLLRRTLLAAGHTAQRYRSATELINAFKNAHLDVLILGTLSGRVTEFEVLTSLRSDLLIPMPVIVVSKHAEEDYIVRVLRTGADEHILLPVGDREFLARVEAVARRWAHIPRPPQMFRAGAITVHLQSRRILVDGEPVHLTIKDFDLAVYLLRNAGRLITRSQLLHAVWGGRTQLLRSRTLDTHISRVRRRLKLLESRGWRLNAVYRRGYRLERLGDDGLLELDR